MATLQELLENKEKYADSLQIQLADGVTTTLGELRAGYMKDADYRRKTSELAELRRAHEREVAEFQSAKAAAEAQLQELAQEIVRSRQASGQSTTKDDIADALERDPVAKRLLNTVEALAKKVEQLETVATNVYQTQEQARQAAIVAEHKKALANIRNEYYKDLDEEAWNEKQRALIEYARRNYVPNLNLAHNLMTERERWEARIKKEVEAAKKQGIEEGKRLAVAPTIPIRNRTLVGELPKDSPKTFDEALDAASRDPEILNILAGN
ncbi:MAG: hypothetical protein ABIN58_07235 [candidate division WOR-3 bacterium]